MNKKAEFTTSAGMNQTSESGIESGDFAGPDAAAPAPRRIVIATFNIRYAVGSFLITGSLMRRLGLRRPGRRSRLVAHNIETAAKALSNGVRMPPADLIALQEADRGTRRAGGRHVARELAQRLRMRYAHAAPEISPGEPPRQKQWYLNFEELIVPDETGDTGVAILSRLALRETERVDLPWTECAWRPRLALSAVLDVGPTRLHIINAHIDPHASLDEQLAQHEAIIAHARKACAARQITVLLGDFNTLRSHSQRATRQLLESHGYVSPLPTGTATWRAGLLRLHADWIFVRGARIVRWGVARPLSVSDHWPVWAEIELID